MSPGAERNTWMRSKELYGAKSVPRTTYVSRAQVASLEEDVCPQVGSHGEKEQKLLRIDVLAFRSARYLYHNSPSPHPRGQPILALTLEDVFISRKGKS